MGCVGARVSRPFLLSLTGSSSPFFVFLFLPTVVDRRNRVRRPATTIVVVVLGTSVARWWKLVGFCLVHLFATPPLLHSFLVPPAGDTLLPSHSCWLSSHCRHCHLMLSPPLSAQLSRLGFGGFGSVGFKGRERDPLPPFYFLFHFFGCFGCF